MENTFGNFLHNSPNPYRNANAETRFEDSDRNINKQSDNRDTHNPTTDGNGVDNNRPRAGHNFEQVLERNFREAFEAEFRQKQGRHSLDFFKKHWFKLGLAVALLFFILKKDLTKMLNFSSEDGDKIEKQGNKLTITPNTKVDDAPLSIIGALTGDGNNNAAEMPAVDETIKRAYLKRFAQVAVTERRKYGVPASLILANATRQSFAGQRVTTAKLNNHFALPLTHDWSGASATIGDKRWRQYENAWVSFRDHSVFVTTGQFSELRQLSNKDYKGWAKGLERLGYPSGNENLANELIDIVEQYGLQELDKIQ